MSLSKDSGGSGKSEEAVMAPLAARKRKAAEAIEKLVTLLIRLGIPVEFIVSAVQAVCARFSQSQPPQIHAAVAEMDAAAHSLTLWHRDAAYLDADGHPRALELRRGNPSLASLVAQADRQVGFEAVLQHLLNQSVVGRIGESSYVPLNRSIVFRGSGDPYHARGLHTLNAMLGTLVHNGGLSKDDPSWYEVYAANCYIPLSARAGFDRRLRKRADVFLEDNDSDLLGLQRSWDGKEPLCCLGVGVYRFEEPGGSSALGERGPTD